MPVYQIAGFVIDSPIELPNLSISLAPKNLSSEIDIRMGSLPTLPKPLSSRPYAGGHIEWFEQGFSLRHPQAGDMIVLGQTIYWQPTASADIKGFRTFLVNALLPAYAVLQDMLPLHISAVSVNGRAIAFQGKSGAGKSTLAAMLMKRGYPVITEDLGVIELKTGSAIMRPGLPYFRLWNKSFTQLEEAPNQENIAWLHRGKYYRSIEDDEFCSIPQQIQAIYFLNEPHLNESIAIESISGLKAASALLKSRFFGVPQHDTEQAKRIFNETMELANQTRCFNLTRPKDFSKADQVIDALINHWTTFELT